MNIIRKKGKIDISFILTFIIIFVSNDTLLFGTNENRIFFWVHVGILLATFVYILFHIHSINKKVVFFSVGIVFFMMMTLVINADTTEIIKYIYNAFVIFLCAIFCKYVSRQRFFSCVATIMYYMSIFAIALFFLWVVAAPVVRIFPSITNESGITYYYLGLGFLEELSAGVLPRMYGVFREPGVFTCFLMFALIIQLYFMENLNIKRVAIISLAAILTFSTAAYILLFTILCGYFLKQLFSRENKHKKVWFLFFVLVASITIIFLVIGPERVMNLVFNKLNVENASRDSRYGSIETNIKMFMQNPALGKGWGYVEDRFIYYANEGLYKGAHNTNTFLKFLALYGICPFMCIAVTTFMFFKKASESVIGGLFLTIVWIVTLSNEDMTVNILFYLLPFYAFGRSAKRRLPVYEENTVD